MIATLFSYQCCHLLCIKFGESALLWILKCSLWFSPVHVMRHTRCLGSTKKKKSTAHCFWPLDHVVQWLEPASYENSASAWLWKYFSRALWRCFPLCCTASWLFVVLMGMQVAQCGNRPVIVLLSSQKCMTVT